MPNGIREEAYKSIIEDIENGKRTLSSVKFPHESYYTEFYQMALQHFSSKNDYKRMAEIHRHRGDYASAARCATVYGDKSMMAEYIKLKWENQHNGI